MKRTISKLAAIVLAALMLCSCAAYRRVSLTSMAVDGITPDEVNREMNVMLKVGLDNPAGKFKIEDVHGEIYSADVCVARFTGEPLVIEGHRRETYPMNCKVTLEPGGTIMAFLRGGHVKDMTMDLHGVARGPLGIKKKVERRGLSVVEVVGKVL